MSLGGCWTPTKVYDEQFPPFRADVLKVCRRALPLCSEAVSVRGNALHTPHAPRLSFPTSPSP
ncbi:hypothetical protein E2C01_034875 [Portunus trituberculatus]|uniref:Uncharacterized protein n=1 Tax=Portunus trituberculatus TaxID=210409 RepID=A0A5B7F6X1_PORTR|nr:hypothetical protein [Portunus trituberculatus]